MRRSRRDDWDGELLESIVTGLVGLLLVGVVALGLATVRTAADSDPIARERCFRWVLIAIAAQALHFGEELLTGFHQRFPELLSQVPWPRGFFVGFNLFWLGVWLASALCLRANVDAAYFPLWFLALAMTLNGAAHPLLAMVERGYFPGLLSSPLVGALGWVLCSRLWALTADRW